MMKKKENKEKVVEAYYIEPKGYFSKEAQKKLNESLDEKIGVMDDSGMKEELKEFINSVGDTSKGKKPSKKTIEKCIKHVTSKNKKK